MRKYVSIAESRASSSEPKKRASKKPSTPETSATPAANHHDGSESAKTPEEG